MHLLICPLLLSQLTKRPNPEVSTPIYVFPAQAGIHKLGAVPQYCMDPRLRGEDIFEIKRSNHNI
jgi:hypothetical protein